MGKGWQHLVADRLARGQGLATLRRNLADRGRKHDLVGHLP